METEVTFESAQKIGRLFPKMDIASLLLDPEKVWSGVVIFQNSLDDVHCSRYLSILNGPATPQERVNAFLRVHNKL